MTVGELIAKLQTYNPDALVVKNTSSGKNYDVHIGVRHHYGAYDKELNVIVQAFPDVPLNSNQEHVDLAVIV